MPYMGRTISPEERIKRAEEIYYRRKMSGEDKKSARVNISNKKDLGMFKKMILQIAICFVIYLIFYMIQNTNYIFSEDVIKKTNEILSYDISIDKLYIQAKEYLNKIVENTNVKTVTLQDENPVEENTSNENFDNKENIGGDSEQDNKEDTNLSQMEQDAKDILQTKSLIIPLKGTITSRFGLRNPETPTVPKNHTGIDIAVNEGTVFVSAMSGVVEEVSNQR